MNPPAETDPDLAALTDPIAVADPQAADNIRRHLQGEQSRLSSRRMDDLAETIIGALAEEVSYGRTLADGLGQMLAGGREADLDRYLSRVTDAAARGPTLAALFARHLVPVLLCGDPRLAERFEMTTRGMLQKGTYTLKAPLEALGSLIEECDLAGAHAFLDLLDITYALDISYNRTVYLTHTLPRAVIKFDRRRRRWQINGLSRAMGEDERLADVYLRGLSAGLQLLTEPALNTFLDRAIDRYREDPEAGARFMGLDSHQAKTMCRDLQVAVPLASVRSTLERYLHARTGLTIGVRPHSALPRKCTGDPSQLPLVHCDGRAIYLPDEMDLLELRSDNAALLKLLVRLEAGAIEFGTYELDVDKAVGDRPPLTPSECSGPADTRSDLQQLLDHFDSPGPALDLFTLFEHARIAHRVHRRYRGLSARLAATLTDVRLQTRTGWRPGGTLLPLYFHLVCRKDPGGTAAWPALFDRMAAHFGHEMAAGSNTAETSARLTMAFYAPLMDYCAASTAPSYDPLCLPFGRRFEPGFFGPFHTAYHRLALDLHHQLAKRRIRVYRSDIHHLLVRQNGQITADQVMALVAGASAPSDAADACDPADLDLTSILCQHGMRPAGGADDGANAFRYREWDCCMNDYLPDRVRVLEHSVRPDDNRFYPETLERYHGLVRRIRYAFELLRPEEMTILRQWREGDAFDYRALLDYALDRRAGLMPSDRLFIKRMKRTRDVAVLLLVDLSRSTANAVDTSGTRVLDVEKQAIVLLCEALQVVGDRFAIAGFSGTGPLGVDYYRIKDLDAPFDESVRGRISAMAPQRSTRMGAAIRHATAQLGRQQARVRLILILGDGFPNDIEYKGTYAVEDTSRAVMEARAASLHVKAITVNVSDNTQLDRLYGRTHHTLIGNVQDLPDKLVRVYSALTRH